MSKWCTGQTQVSVEVLHSQKRIHQTKTPECSTEPDGDQQLTHIFVFPRDVRLWALKRIKQKSTCHGSTRSWKESRASKKPSLLPSTLSEMGLGTLRVYWLLHYILTIFFSFTTYPWTFMFQRVITHISAVDVRPSSFMGQCNAHVMSFTAFILL